MRAHIVHATLVAALAAGAAGSASCTSSVRQGTGSSFLIVESLQGVSGADEATGTNLQSDVRTKGGIIEDEGLVVFRLAMKDAAIGPSPNNFITVNRYRVVFLRADGRNTPGVDVPHPFDGALTVTVGEGTAQASFSLVRVQAKGEPPLRNLAGGFGLGVISTIAEVTFFGQDQTGHAVSVTARISVDFADFADPD